MNRLELWFGDQYEREKGRYLQIKGDNVLKKITSPFQEISVVETPAFGKVLINDGIIMLTEADEMNYHEMITHVPLCVHSSPEKVLVIGGGDGGTVREILKHKSVKKIDVCEIDKKVIDICQEFFPALASSFNNPKVEVYYEDGSKFLERKEKQYDVIIVDSSDPIGPGTTLFTEKFYQSLYNSLKDDGTAVTQMESLFWHANFIKNIFQFIKNIFPIPYYYYTMVPTYPSGMIGFSFCSKKYHPINNFISERAESLIDLKYYHSGIHEAAFMLPAFVKNIF
ncbi:MAG: polyamine aminopropyltransferase [Atribacterota bacterium]|nr:polyamine aminopropyltransferase [Atribacterota bacterium]